MARPSDSSRRLAVGAFTCALLALPLWLLSFVWVPFAITGREVGAVRYVILAAEVGALLAALLAIGLGLAARIHVRAGSRDYKLASRALVIGALSLVVILGLNILGAIFG